MKFEKQGGATYLELKKISHAKTKKVVMQMN
jgi:hypothetical protein